MKTSVYIAITLDGFIAREDGTLDWLPGSDGVIDPEMINEDYGYKTFFDSIDTMVMGRNTFDFVSSMDEWHYKSKKVIVYSRSLKHLDPKLPDSVSISSDTPQIIYNKLKESGSKHVYIDGGQTIQSFLKARLIDQLILTVIPVLIGKGIPLFSELDSDVKLELVKTDSFKNGIIQCIYNVKK